MATHKLNLVAKESRTLLATAKFVGTVMLGVQDVCLEQFRAGMAWHYKYFQAEQTPETEGSPLMLKSPRDPPMLAYGSIRTLSRHGIFDAAASAQVKSPFLCPLPGTRRVDLEKT